MHHHKASGTRAQSEWNARREKCVVRDDCGARLGRVRGYEKLVFTSPGNRNRVRRGLDAAASQQARAHEHALGDG